MAVLVVVLLNKVIEYILTFLSKFEKHNYLSQEYVSRIKKTFGALVLSTGIIIVV